MDPLDRIAAALERLAPPRVEDAELAPHGAYVWRDGRLTAARAFRPLPLDLLTGIDAQKAALLDNARRHAAGHAAHDALLWGARGMGKSALVKSVVGAVQGEGGALALVEATGDRIATLPALFARLADGPQTIVFLDDLGFDDGMGDARALRSLLEGGAEARPGNVRLHVTSNRRHIVPRDMNEQAIAINPRDAADDGLALADRFGLSIGFHVANQDEYLAMAKGYADAAGLDFDAADALLFAQQRGSRSGRVAWHYAVELAGRAGRPLAL